MTVRPSAGWLWSVVTASALGLCGAFLEAQEDPVPTQREDVPVEEGEEDGPNQGNLSLSGGFDIASAYIFRGIPQENQGVIIQPYLEVGATLLEAKDNLPSISASAGLWNSLHSAVPSNPWYESDFYAGLSAGLPMGFEAGVTYVYLYNPRGGDIFAEEIDLSISWDESAVIEGLPISFNPEAVVAFEIDGGSDALGAGGDLGTYLELGVTPTYELALEGAAAEYPLTLSVPLKVGIGLEDYYEDAAGDDDSFGFFDVALAVGVPLSFMPSSYGSWRLTGSVHFTFLGDSAANIGGPSAFNVTDGDDFIAWTSWGVSFEY